MSQATLPASDDEIREIIRKTLPEVESNDFATQSRAHHRLAFLVSELDRVGRKEIYYEEPRRHEWIKLGFDPDMPREDGR